MTSKSTVVLGPQASLPEAHLWARNGKNVGRRYTVNLPEQIIGRTGAEQIDIEVDDERVSLQHCRLVVMNGRHHIIDLGSTNGTFVNDQRVDEAELRDGDLIQIGETIFEYLSYEERNLTITLRGSTDNVVPPSLRSGAQQLLQRERSAGPDDRALVPAQAAMMSGLPQPLPPAVQGAMTPGSVMPQYPPGMYMPPQPTPQTISIPRDEDAEMSLADLWAMVKKVLGFFGPYWKSILAFIILGAIGGVISYVALPPPAKAVFQMTLEQKASENPVGVFQRSNVAFFRAAEQAFKSPVLIERTLNALGDSEVSPDRLDAISKKLTFERIALTPNTPIYPGQIPSNTYNGSYTSTDPDMAVKFLETHVKLYLDSEIEKTLKVIRVEVDFLTQEMAKAQKELNRTDWDLQEFKRKNIDALPQQARQYYDYLFDLQKRESDAGKELAKSSAVLQHDVSRMSSEERLVTSRHVDAHPYKAAIAEKERLLAEAQASGKGNQHPDVVRLLRELGELQALEKEAEDNKENDEEKSINPSYSKSRDELSSAQVNARLAAIEAGRIRKDLSRIKGVVERLPQLEAEHGELQREYDAAKSTYTKLEDELKKAKLQLELERAAAVARYDIISPPAIEYTPPLKNIAIRLGIGAGAAFGFALLQAGLRGMRRFKKQQKKAAETALQPR